MVALFPPNSYLKFLNYSDSIEPDTLRLDTIACKVSEEYTNHIKGRKKMLTKQFPGVLKQLETKLFNHGCNNQTQ